LTWGAFHLWEHQRTPLPLWDELLAGYGEVAALPVGQELVGQRRCWGCGSWLSGWGRLETLVPAIPRSLGGWLVFASCSASSISAHQNRPSSATTL
jgi:hypothetical protein